MNLSQIRAYIRARYASDLMDSEIDEHVNETYLDLSRLFTPDSVQEEQITTVAGQDLYTLTLNSRRILEVHLGTGASRERLASIRHSSVTYPRTSGTPTRWYPHGMTTTGIDVKQRFGLDPVPSTSGQVINVLSEPEPARLANTTDQPQYVPEEMHHLIAYGALSLAAGKAQDYNLAQHWESRYRMAYNEVLGRLGRNKINYPEAAKQGEVS